MQAKHCRLHANQAPWLDPQVPVQRGAQKQRMYAGRRYAYLRPSTVAAYCACTSALMASRLFWFLHSLLMRCSASAHLRHVANPRRSMCSVKYQARARCMFFFRSACRLAHERHKYQHCVACFAAVTPPLVRPNASASLGSHVGSRVAKGRELAGQLVSRGCAVSGSAVVFKWTSGHLVSQSAQDKQSAG